MEAIGKSVRPETQEAGWPPLFFSETSWTDVEITITQGNWVQGGVSGTTGEMSPHSPLQARELQKLYLSLHVNKTLVNTLLLGVGGVKHLCRSSKDWAPPAASSSWGRCWWPFSHEGARRLQECFLRAQLPGGAE